MTIRRIGTTLACLLVALCPVLLVACGQSLSAQQSTEQSMEAKHPGCCSSPLPPSVPRGWKSYTYGEATISVPSDWIVVTSYACPKPKEPGTLFLGPSENPDEVCPMYSLSVNSVTIAPVSLQPGDACTRTGEVNGLMVEITPCGSGDATSSTVWTVPSLGIQAVATQAEGGSVGSGSSTVVERVLHTLRKASGQ
jgi:hypothetical protein